MLLMMHDATTVGVDLITISIGGPRTDQLLVCLHG
ncbi:hypothetical protein AB3S75_012984 [Citrus x aurantiifolia]